MATRTASRKGKGGRPSKLDQVHTRRTRSDGTTVDITNADRIIELIGAGAYVERACKTVDIAKGTFYGWLQVAGHARAKLAANPNARLSAHERRCVEFSDAVDRAEAEYEMGALLQLERLAAGLPVEKVTERYEVIVDANGQQVERLVERKVVRERNAPDARVIMWKLTRRFPERYQLQPNAGAAEPGELIEADITEGSLDDLMADIERFTAELHD